MQVSEGVLAWSLYFLLLLLLLLPVSTDSKKGKKLEETGSFDVKPSGQIAHETIKLVGGRAVKDTVVAESVNVLKHYCLSEKWSDLHIHLRSSGRNQ